MSRFLCTRDDRSPVTIESEARALTLAARGYTVTDLDAVEDEKPAEKPKPAPRKKAASKPAETDD